MSNQKNLCNVLREEWWSIITLIDYASTLLDRLLQQIRTLLNRIKNTILNQIASAIRNIKDIIAKYLGLSAIDNAAARKDFCRILYTCQPAIEILTKYIGSDFFNVIFGTDSIKVLDLKKYGITYQTTFNSKFELFEYVACRLSLSSMLDSAVENMISSLLQLISKFTKYLDVDWWLNNTMPGRVLRRLIAEYDAVFNNYIKPFLDKLTPFMNCGFALCDFSFSTTNYLDDFASKYKANLKTLPDMSKTWEITKTALYSDLTDSMTDMKSTLTTFQNKYNNTLNGAQQVYQKATKSNETTPFSSDELQQKNNGKTGNMLTSSLNDQNELHITTLRQAKVLSTPNSDVGLA